MLSDPWLKCRALRKLLDDCLRIMGPQNAIRRARGCKWSHNHNFVIHYSHKFSRLLLDSLQCPLFGLHCPVWNLTRGFEGLMQLQENYLTHLERQSMKRTDSDCFLKTRQTGDDLWPLQHSQSDTAQPLASSREEEGVGEREGGQSKGSWT